MKRYNDFLSKKEEKLKFHIRNCSIGAQQSLCNWDFIGNDKFGASGKCGVSGSRVAKTRLKKSGIVWMYQQTDNNN